MFEIVYHMSLSWARYNQSATHWPSPEDNPCHRALFKITTPPLDSLFKFPRHLVSILFCF